MSVITRAQHPAAAWPGIKDWFGMNYKEWESVWTQIYEDNPSSQSYEESVEEVPFGILSTKTEGGSIVYDTSHQGYTQRHTHVTYGLGYKVTLEEMLFNQYEKLSLKRAGRLARSVRETEEILHARDFNRAFDTNFTFGDGTTFLSTSHPTDAGNQSNRLTNDADLSEASIEDMCIQIDDSKDSRGLRFNNNIRRLIIQHANRFEATRILKSVLQNDTANNAVNAIKAENVFPEGTLVWRYLTDPDAWFVQTDCENGMVHYTAMDATFDKDQSFDNKNACASVITIFTHGFDDWRCMWGTEGA
jgi:hypothetical protein